jgi:hypothetical protein
MASEAYRARRWRRHRRTHRALYESVFGAVLVLAGVVTLVLVVLAMEANR